MKLLQTIEGSEAVKRAVRETGTIVVRMDNTDQHAVKQRWVGQMKLDVEYAMCVLFLADGTYEQLVPKQGVPFSIDAKHIAKALRQAGQKHPSRDFRDAGPPPPRFTGD